jgi:hypothetical protein
MISSPSIYLQMTSFHYSLWLNKTLLYIHTHTHIYIYHIFLIHLSVVYLDCFHNLSIVNSATINMGVIYKWPNVFLPSTTIKEKKNNKKIWVYKCLYGILTTFLWIYAHEWYIVWWFHILVL